MTTGGPGSGSSPRDHIVRDLTLMLMYLTSWRTSGQTTLSVWKGYEFGVLDRFREEGYTSGSNKAKSATLHFAGVEAARALIEGYGLTEALDDMADWGLDLKEHEERMRGLLGGSEPDNP